MCAPEPHEATLMHEDSGSGDEQCRQRKKPPGAPERRPDDEAQDCSVVVPDAITVGCDDFECVRARRQMRVISATPCASLNPILVHARQFIFEAYVLGLDKTETGVTYF